MESSGVWIVNIWETYVLDKEISMKNTKFVF